MGGISRWFQERELRSDLKAIENFDAETKAALKEAVNYMMGMIRVKLHISIYEIMDSQSYHIVKNADWGKAPWLINTNLRIPFLKQIKAGDTLAVPMYFGVSVVLHSVRAIIDYEFNQNKKLLFWCQKMWYEFSSDDIENIPPRFRAKS